MREKRIALFILMIGIGLALGLLYGWVINPVKYSDTTPDKLRADYKTDYVLMVAEIYHADQNLDQAARRLAVLGSQPAARIAADALSSARSLSYSGDDLDRISELSEALQKMTPAAGVGGQP